MGRVLVSLTGLLAMLCVPGLSLNAKNDFYGYFENRFFLVDNRDIAWSSFDQKFQIGDYNRLRLMGKFSPDEKEKVVLNVAVDLFTFHGILTSPLGISNPGQAQSQTAKIDLDRAYVDIYLKKFDISVGKQRVAMGVSYLWAPLDIFNRVNLFEPKEEKPGATAFRVYVPIAGKTSVTGVFAPEESFGSSKSALRGATQLGNVDIGFTLMRWGSRDETIWGLDLRGENVIGWWLEGGLFSTPQRQHCKLVVGFDTTIPLKRGLYWLGEFFYDSSGEADPARYDFSALLSGERQTLGRAYFMSMLRWAASEFLSASLSYIGNWSDGSWLLCPALAYDLTQSLNLSVGFYLPVGAAAGELSRRRQNFFFVWLKMNF